MQFSPLQCKAARVLLEWSQDRLAEAAHVSKRTVAGFEAGSQTPMHNNLVAIQRALEDAGVRFLEDSENGGRGVMLTRTKGDYID